MGIHIIAISVFLDCGFTALEFTAIACFGFRDS